MVTLDSSAPISISTSIDQLRKKPSETATRGKNDYSNALTKCSVSEELDVNHALEMSPGSSPSSADAKNIEDHTNDLNSRHGVRFKVSFSLRMLLK